MEFCWNARPHATPTAAHATPTAAHATPTAAHATSTAAQQRKRPQASKITLNNVQEHFRYFQRHQVLVCKEHATGIQNVNVHLRDQHDVASEERKAIVEYCRR